VNYQILPSAEVIAEIACLVFVFLQLQRMARVRHERRWAPLKWLSGRLPRERRSAATPASLGSPIMSPPTQDQVAADARDLELRRRLKKEAEHGRAAARREAAITGAVVALPVIAGLTWAALAWWGAPGRSRDEICPHSRRVLRYGQPR
jgi:hypothetical protein